MRTVRVDRGTPSVWGLFQDKINVTADLASGNVYVLWAQYPGQAANNTLHFARSTDHGQTFSKPVRITSGQSEEQFADATVGPDGTLYVTYRTIAHQKSTADAIWLVRSTNAGEWFSAPQLVAGITPFDSTQFSGNGADTCGDGPFACPSGLTFARFSSQSAVAADATGVHVVYSAETAGGQAKILVRNSPDGLSWPSDPTTLDAAPTGHQFFPDVTSAGGTISAVFQDSRTDPAYSPGLPPGNTAAGVNSGNVVHAILARSTNGVSWTEQQLSTAGSNPNWEVRSSARSPFFGDYNYVSAVGRRCDPSGRTRATSRRGAIRAKRAPTMTPTASTASRPAAGCPTTSTRRRTARRRLPTPVSPRALSTRTSTSRPRAKLAGDLGPPAPTGAVAPARSGEYAREPRDRRDSQRFHNASTAPLGTCRFTAAMAHAPLWKRVRGDGRCPARTGDLLLVRHEQLLRSAAACH